MVRTSFTPSTSAASASFAARGSEPSSKSQSTFINAVINCSGIEVPLRNGKSSLNAKFPRATRRQRIQSELENKIINDKKEQTDMKKLREGFEYVQFGTNPSEASCCDSGSEGAPIKTGLALAAMLITNACKPEQLLSAFCNQTGTRFTALPDTKEGLPLTAPDTCPINSTTQATPSNIPTLSDIGNSILSFGQSIYNSLPALPRSRMLVEAHTGGRQVRAFWGREYPHWGAGGNQKVVTNNTAEKLRPNVFSAFPSSLDADAIMGGLNAFQRWPANINQDERLKGIALTRLSDNIANIYQLLDVFKPLILRNWGSDPTISQYEYSVLKYAVQSQSYGTNSTGVSINPAEPQLAWPQAELRHEIAQLFFMALTEINRLSGTQALSSYINSKAKLELATNPTLDKLSKFSDRIKAEIIHQLEIQVPNFLPNDRSKLNLLAKWFVDATLIGVDPLFHPQLDLDHPDFRYASYLSPDGTLMSIGAGFMNQFPAKAGGRMTPEVLREAGLHSLIDLDPLAWSSSTGTALIRFDDSRANDIAGERLGSAADRMKSGLAFLIAPEIPKIRLMQKVKLSEEEFLICVNDRFNDDAVHNQQSKDALGRLEQSKFDLYNYGLEHLPLSHQKNLIRAAHFGALEIFVPRVILYEGKHGDIAHKATFKATSGLIASVGNSGSGAPPEYYLFSEEGYWGSPVVSVITSYVKESGGVAAYVNKHHASFTSGVRFKPSNQTSFETASFSTYATNLKEIALVVSQVQSFPSAIHQRFTDASSTQRMHITLAQKIFSSSIYTLGKFIIGMVPYGNCVIAVLDTAEMVALPAETDKGKVEQATVIATDALFCFTGLVNEVKEAKVVMNSARAVFRSRSPNEFAETKIKEHLAGPSLNKDEKVGLTNGGLRFDTVKHLANNPADLHFRTGISHFIEFAPSAISPTPNKISFKKDNLNVPNNLVPKGLFQKSEGGPICLVLALDNTEKRVGYLWNESEKQLELQTDQWFDAYSELTDEDIQIVDLFTKNAPTHITSTRISDMLYNNKCLNAVRKFYYQSYFAHPPENINHGVYTVGDRQYLKLDEEFYLLEEQSKPSLERRIIGEQMPEDLSLDVQYDGKKWRVIKNYLITPATKLTNTVATFEEAIKHGFNLPEGWSTSAMFFDNSNPDQFVLSLRDSEGNTKYRLGPNRKGALDELEITAFEKNRCRIKRAPPFGSQAACGSQGAYFASLPAEAARKEAINQLVELDVETRPYYERPLLQLEIVRDVEKIQNAFQNNPELSQHFLLLTDNIVNKPKLTLVAAMEEVGQLKWADRELPADRLMDLTDFWEEIKSQLASESSNDFGRQREALGETCELNLRLVESQRQYDELGNVYINKVRWLNKLNREYESDFVEAQQSVTSRLWKTIFGPALTSGFTKSGGWTFEVRAKGFSQIREKYGAEFASEIRHAYAYTHDLAGQLVDWSQNAPQQFWSQTSTFFHVEEESLTSDYKQRILQTLTEFQGYSAPDRVDKLRVISPSVSPEGVQYKYNVQEHVRGVPQEATLFGNVVTAYTYTGGPRRGQLYLTTSAFLSPVSGRHQLGESLQHELSHLAIPDSHMEIYLDAGSTKYGHYPINGMRRNADAILSSPAAFLKYAELITSVKQSFLEHFKLVSPDSLEKYLPEGLADVSDKRFEKFIKKLFQGPADDKVKAFMLPDIFVAWCQHMLSAIPEAGAEQAKMKNRRHVAPNDMDTQVHRLLVRELFDSGNQKKNNIDSVPFFEEDKKGPNNSV
ncbi:hypothetical protein RGU75_17975 [Glaciimonas sp. CA11.2]|uniref:hypothetical protein n=1 Tax=Glaciimonas sp. CA11.2 TaxID=3048601 RepID=UPI002AB41168|nr:hypothetical protein [Glaciimonas sp. CA11.2]MDY7548114.1 hypothetical protein [Glaciimonas sp. CA11.2]